MECQIPANPDIAGVGVRVSIYFQALFAMFSTVIRFSSLENHGDRNSRHALIKSTFIGSMTMIFTGLAIAVSGVIQAKTYGMSTYHALLMLDLCWVIIIGALAPFFLMISIDNAHYMSNFRCGLFLYHPNPITKTASRLHMLHSLHFTFTSCIGLWVFSRLPVFDPSSSNCTRSTIAVIVGHEHLVTSHAYRIFSLILYATFTIPILNVFLAQLFLLILPMGLLSAIWLGCRLRDHMYYNLNADWIGPLNLSYILSAPLCAITLVIISTEQTIHANNVTSGEAQWTLGQTLALMAAFISTIDFDLWLWHRVFGKVGWDSNARMLVQSASTQFLTGSSDIACEEFIQALRARARAAGKKEDEKWILRVKKGWNETMNALLDKCLLEDSEEVLEYDAEESGIGPQWSRGLFRMEEEADVPRQLWLSYNASSGNMELASSATSAVKVCFEDNDSGDAFKIYMPETNCTQMVVWKPNAEGFLRLSGGREKNLRCVANKNAAGPVWTLDARSRLQARYKINDNDSAFRAADHVFVHVRTLEVEMATSEEFETLFGHWWHRLTWARREDYFTGHLIFEPLEAELSVKTV